MRKQERRGWEACGQAGGRGRRACQLTWLPVSLGPLRCAVQVKMCLTRRKELEEQYKAVRAGLWGCAHGSNVGTSAGVWRAAEVGSVQGAFWLHSPAGPECPRCVYASPGCRRSERRQRQRCSREKARWPRHTRWAATGRACC